jgi:hypothetical protein
MSINHRSIDQARWLIDDWSIKPLIDRRGFETHQSIHQGMLNDRAD